MGAWLLAWYGEQGSGGVINPERWGRYFFGFRISFSFGFDCGYVCSFGS
jgi:hypothetical protein